MALDLLDVDDAEDQRECVLRRNLFHETPSFSLSQIGRMNVEARGLEAILDVAKSNKLQVTAGTCSFDCCSVLKGRSLDAYRFWNVCF